MVGKSLHETEEASYLRKLRKPMIEKKRRDRMNVSIDNMKAILAKSAKNAGSVVKMDKAEILELAVAHLTQMQQRPKSTGANQMVSYRAGFRECRKETLRYLSSSALMPNPLLEELDSHLQNASACTASRQNDTIITSAARRHGFFPDRLCTSSPTIDLPPVPVFSPFCRDTLFSPISSVDIRGHSVHSPIDSLYINPTNRSISPCSALSPATSPAPSACSSVASDSGASGMSVDISSDLGGSSSKSDGVLGHVIKQEAPWRPW